MKPSAFSPAPFRVTLCTVLLWALTPFVTATAAQPFGYERGDSLYFADKPTEALALYDSLLTQNPADFEVLWRASRAALNLGILAADQDSKHPMYIRAEALARQATLLLPARVEGHYWLAGALGRRSLHADLKNTAKFANATVESAQRAMAIDSNHAGVHDIIGKVHSEVRAQPGILRFMAGRILGMSVARMTSYELAEKHLKRAVELDSTSILYRMDLGQLYVRMKLRDKAEPFLKAAIAMPRVHPADIRFQQEAAELLAKHR